MNRTISFKNTLLSKSLAKCICLCVGLFLFQNIGKAQSIQINKTIFTLGTYSKGGNISVPIKLNGCFDTSSVIQLYLSDANGNFPSGGTLIGGYNYFFSPFVNGIIPPSTSDGSKYKVRVVTTSPFSADTSGVFGVGTGPGLISGLSAQAPSATDQFNDSTFGNCQSNASQLVLKINTPTTGTLSVKAYDSLGSSQSVTLGNNEFFFTPKADNYYFVTVSYSNGSILSSRSYLVYYSSQILSLQNQGQTEKCFPVIQTFSVNISDATGIKNNYPGTVYTLSWGDGSTTSLSQCQLIQSGGVFTHLYNSSSCGQPTFTVNAITVNNAFEVGIDAQNNICNKFTPENTYLKLFQKPIPDFSNPGIACINILTTFNNLSNIGAAAPGNGVSCSISNATFSWEVDNNPFTIDTSENLNYTFTTTGVHTVNMKITNLPCNADTTETICIQPPAIPSFLLNGLDSISECAPKTVAVTNNTPSVSCSPNKYAWQVIDSSTGLIIDSSSGVYKVTPNLSSPTPVFVFNVSGTYLLQLTASNSCGPNTLSKKVNINGVTNVSLPSNQTYCGTKTIDFSVSPNRPSYNSTGANEQYHWTVSGGTYSFVNGTSATSAYPQIQFSDYTTYTITLQFTNNCGSKTVTQQITFNQSPSPNAGNDTTVCYSLTSIPLSAIVTGGSIISGAWSTSNGNGKFGDTSAANTTYTFGTIDKQNLSVTLLYSVKTNSTACAVINAQRVITMLPQNAITNSTPITICSGNYANFTPVSSTANSTYNWTSKVFSGTATGNTPSGKGSINDFLTNTSITQIDTLEYIIIPRNGNCNGTPDSLLVIINPKPTISLDSIAGTKVCATATGGIVLQGLATTTTYTVTYNGTSNSFSSDASGTLTITGLEAGTYNNIYVTSAAGCNSDTIGPFTLKDPNPPTTPVASAVNDILCSGSTLSLTANSSTSGVSYSWSGPNSFTNTAQSPSISNVQTTGTGTYSVTATLAGCTSAADTVNVVVNQTPATPIIDSIQPLCSGEKLTLNASTFTIGNISYTWTGPNGFVSNAGNAIINPVTAADSGFYKVIAFNTYGTFSCVSQPDSISVVVRPSITQATIIGSKDTLICGFTSLSNNTGILSGNLDASRPYETGSWSVVSKPSGASPSIAANTSKSATITFDKSGVYLVQWAISNGVCASSTDTIQFTVFDKPGITTPLIAPVNVCADNPVTVTIDTNGIYGQIKYWQIKQPYAAASWMDTLVQSPSITFPNVQDTFRVRLVVVSKDTLHCGTDSVFIDTLINVNPPSNAGIASTNGTSPLCYKSNSGTITLTGNTGSATWQSSTDSINFANTSSTGQQYTYSNLTQNTWFRSAVKSGTCDTVFSNAVKVTVLPPLTISNAGNNVTLCADSIFQLQANTPLSNETGTWSWLASSDSGTLDNKQNPTTFARGLKANTNYTLTWTISNNVCTPSSSKVTITNLGPLTNVIDTTTQTMCNSATVTVNGQTPTGGDKNYNYQWQVKQGNSWFSIQGATNVSYTFTADTTVVLQRLVIDSPCTSASLQTTIYVQPPLGNNFISGSNQACINTSPGLLIGSVPTGAGGNFMYQWQSSTDTVNIGWANLSGADTQNYTPPVLNLNDTNYYRRIVTTNLCSGSQANNSAGFVVFVRPNASASWVVKTDTSCAPFNINNDAVSPILDTITNSSYNWYANDTLYGSSAAINPGYTLVPAYDSVVIKMVTVSRYGCKNDSLSSWFYTPPSPRTKFKVSDSLGCGPLADTLTNTTSTLGYFQYSWKFGFDTTATSTLAQPGVVVFPPNPFNKDTIYTVTLTGFNQCDTVIYSRNIMVRSKAKAIFTPSATFGCSPLTDTFINTSRGDSTTYVWQFGDGATKLAKDSMPVIHTYHTGAQDTFTVKLLAKNYCGSDTSQYDIVVAAGTIKMQITVNGNELTGCNPSTVHFINTTQGASTFNWDFGDGNHAVSKQSPFNLDTVTHRYDSVGVFNVTIDASNNCTDTTGFQIIKVLSTPKAAFVATPDTVCVGHPISFTNKSNSTTGLIWNFGDGGSSLATNPQYTYSKAGNYDVQLIAERQHPTLNICMDTSIRQVTVVPSLPGSITVNDSVSTCVPFTVTFTSNNASSSKTCTWNFGDTTTGTGNTITHTFTKVGVYSVLMNAVDSGGCNYIATKQITVNGPVGSFTYNHGIVCGGTPVNFFATVMGTDSLLWDFGNNSVLTTLPNTPVYYTYPQSGRFVPSVNLVSSKGSCMVQLKGSDTIAIDYVKAGFTISELKVCDTTTVNFIDTSSAWLGMKTWTWSFGNGKSSTTQNPTQVFMSSNTWPTNLIVKSSSGCADTAYIPTFIKVNNTPKAIILADTTGCEDQPQLNIAAITSVDSVTYFNWQFSNGATGNTDTVNAYFSTPGAYKTKLVVGTSYGCYDTVGKSVLIYPTPQVVTTPDFRLCKGQSAFVNTTGATTYEWTPSIGLSCNTCPNPVASPIVTTRYVVSGFNSFGCADRDTLLITVPQPFTLTTSGNDTMCIGTDSLQLTVSGASNYNWTPSVGLSASNIPTPKAAPPLTTTYRVIGSDDYNCFADTSYLVVAVGTYPIVTLGLELTLSTGTNITLNPVFTYPTQTAGPISKYVWSPGTYLSCDTCPNPTATVENNICYTLTATNIYGCNANIDTLCIKAFCKNTQVFIANAFSPDGDGVNDKLVVQGKGIRVVKSFKIFSRWGQVVFERDNFPPNDPSYGWDGTIKGVLASPDVYVYTCQVTCENDVTFEYKGNTAIIK